MAGADSNNDMVVFRLTGTGALDTTFGSNGKVTTDLGGWETGNSLSVQADGKILLGGSSDTDFALVRYNTDGSLDNTFTGVGGTVNDAPVANNDSLSATEDTVSTYTAAQLLGGVATTP